MTLDDAAIERLVQEAQAGDAWAFGRLFDHYHLPIYRFIASRVRRPSDAEDLTQLVFVKALEALPRYESRGIPFGGWLFRLARNAVIDFVRTSHEHADLAQSVDRADANAGPDELAVIRQEIDAVGTALSTLTDDQRDAIALRFFAGLSAREAAEVMGKQEGTVRGLQFRAIAALRRELGIEEPEITTEAGRSSIRGSADGRPHVPTRRPARSGDRASARCLRRAAPLAERRRHHADARRRDGRRPSTGRPPPGRCDDRGARIDRCDLVERSRTPAALRSATRVGVKAASAGAGRRPRSSPPR